MNPTCDVCNTHERSSFEHDLPNLLAWKSHGQRNVFSLLPFFHSFCMISGSARAQIVGVRLHFLLNRDCASVRIGQRISPLFLTMSSESSVSMADAYDRQMPTRAGAHNGGEVVCSGLITPTAC